MCVLDEEAFLIIKARLIIKSIMTYSQIWTMVWIREIHILAECDTHH